MSSILARRLTLGLFVIQAVTLVFTVGIGTPPDENNHIQFIQYYSNHSLSPVIDHQQPTYYLGDKTREVDYLYHYFASLVYRILPMSVEAKYIVLRLITVALALLSLLVLAKVLKRLGLSAAVITTALLIIVNIPMVLLMSSAINNDVLVWLGTFTGMLLLLKLWERPSALYLTWLFSLSLAGGLVKRSLLPFCLVFGVLGVAIFIKHSKNIIKAYKRPDWRLIMAALVVVISFGLFAERVGKNVVSYGAIAPTCEQVQGEAACQVFWGSIRQRALAQRPPEPTIEPATFVPKWFGESFGNVLDIQTQAWKHQVKPAKRLMYVMATLLLTGLAYGIVYDLKKRDHNKLSRYRLYIAFIAIFYILVQLAVNYGTYQQYKVFKLALNGRYIIPGLLPLIGLATFYWSKLMYRHPKLLTGLAVGVILFMALGSGLLMMLRNTQLYQPYYG